MTRFSLKGTFTTQYDKHGTFYLDLVAESAVFESLKSNDTQTLEDFHIEIMDKGCRLQKLIMKFINSLNSLQGFPF